MIFSKTTKLILFTLLIALNVILRFQPEFREVGLDSFFIHSMINSLNEFGYCKWALHPLSFFGLYPYSYTSSIQFLLSGVSQSAGVGVEQTIFTMMFIMGTFCVFSMYILAGQIIKDDIFKFFVALGYSTCQAILTYTTLTIPTRGLFIVLAPIGIFLLLKIRQDYTGRFSTEMGANHTRFKKKYVLLFIIFFTLLFTTHHLAYFLIPVVCSLLILLLYENVIHKKISRYVIFTKNEIISKMIFVAGFLIMYSIPFFTGKFLGISRYSPIYLGYIRYTGILIVFALGGLIYLILKNNKKFHELFLILSTMLLVPLIYRVTYMKWFLPIFAILLAGVGFLNICNMVNKRRFPHIILSIIIITAVVFSGYYQFLHTDFDDRSIKVSTFEAGQWAKYNIIGNLISNNRWEGIKMSAITDTTHFLTGSTVLDHIYGFLNADLSQFEKISPLSEEFYRGSYKGVDFGEHTWAAINRLERHPSSFNLTHVVEDTRWNGLMGWGHRPEPSDLLISVYKNNNIYNNGNIKIWSV